MNEKLQEIVDSLKDVEGIIGIAVFSKFGALEYSFLPDWLDTKHLLNLINNILEISNNAVSNLKRGEIIRMTLECTAGNLLISKIGREILIFITEKDVSIKLFDRAKESRELEFKIQKKI